MNSAHRPGADLLQDPDEPAEHSERPEDHLVGLRPVCVPIGAVRAALLLLEEVGAQPGQSVRMLSNAKDVHAALAPALTRPATVPEPVVVPGPAADPAVVLPGQAVSIGSTVQISVRIPAGLKKAIKLACLARGMQVQEGVLAALQHWLNTVEPHPDDAFWRDQLLSLHGEMPSESSQEP